MIEELTQLMVHFGATWVLWLLFGLSAVSVAVAAERAWVFRGVQANLDALVPELRKLLRKGDQARAQQWLEGTHSVQGRVVLSGLAEAEQGAEAAEEAMAAAIGMERARLEKRLMFLGTVGNNAPFVGLLGTVIGVVGAFEELGRPQAMAGALGQVSAMAPERVMATIAEALVATAVGLVVAIPAVAVFNHFQTRVSSALADAQTLGHVLLSHLKGERNARHVERDADKSDLRSAAE